nr:tape measure protein [Clavibacter michiganensis]
MFGSAVKGIGAGLAVGIGAAVAGAAAIASKGLDRALNIQDAKAQLTGLGHSAESVSTIMGSALESVKGTAFGLDAAATIAASSVAAGIAPGEALTRTLKLTADAATIGKTSLSEMGGIINKVATSGKLSTEVLQQFGDRGVPLLQFVAAQYGVTADEAAAMVSRGEVDFATFQNALEAGVGGAALSSGATARGAFANIGAAFSRLGALFVGSAVDGAPTLFTSIAGAVDRATTALTPFAASMNEKLIPAMAGLGIWIDSIDFGKIIASIQEFYLGAVDVKDLLLTGFTENETLLPPGVVTGLQTAHDVLVSVGEAFQGVVSSFQSGDFSGPISSIGESFTTLKPALSDFASQMPKIGAAVADLAAAALPILTGALGFLADNVDTIISLMPLIVAGFAAWKVASGGVATASIALRTAELAALPGQIARNGLRLAAAALEWQVAAATRASTAAELTANGAKNAGILANARAAAAMVASKAAQLAGAAATGIATAAQWAFNAAMSANPIAIIIIAIAALVAGLIFFFTQTELGQEIWANFTKFLGEAWANIVAVATTVFTALGEFFTTIWNFIVTVVTTYINLVLLVITTVITAIVTAWNATWNFISTVISTVWSFIVSVVTTYINMVMLVITTVVGTIVAAWTATWNFIVDVISTVFTAVVSFVTTYINTVQSVITSVVSGIASVWNSTWSAIGAFFQSIWNAIVSFVSGAVNGVASAISGFVSNVQSGVDNVIGFITGLPDTILATLGDMGDLLLSSGEALIQGFIDGIKNMVGGVSDAVGGVMDLVGGFFPNSPAKRGPFSGSGWTRLKKSGVAIGDQFAAGLQSVEPALTARMNSLMTTAEIAATGIESSARRSSSADRSAAPASINQTTNIYPQETDPLVLGKITGRTIVEQLAGM